MNLNKNKIPKFPPTIIDTSTSSDTVIEERSKISLRCEASGYPEPNVSWRREDNKEINLGTFGGRKYTALKVEGEYLNISQVSRENARLDSIASHPMECYLLWSKEDNPTGQFSVCNTTCMSKEADFWETTILSGKLEPSAEKALVEDYSIEI
ncbi:lachesin [Caerostris extrusa]|uniref:Lachesin n=1 Tax=Caerostris extrusa TaxID=172846 RepID=A0AAV4XY30_CAEEX|nr:lachesin [Caerostris extrusa]